MTGKNTFSPSPAGGDYGKGEVMDFWGGEFPAFCKAVKHDMRG